MNNMSSCKKPIVWVTSGLDRVWRDSGPGDLKDIGLFAARGEYEAFQVVIKAPEGCLSNVNFSITDLSGNDNTVISKSNITLYREHYTYISKPSYQRGTTVTTHGQGWYPDPLIPFNDPNTVKMPDGEILKAVPFNLEAHINQAIWIDIYVPRDAGTGEYTGSYIVTSDQGETWGNIKLTVWNFDLPLKASLKSAFLLWNQITKGAAEEIMKHKLMCEYWNIGLEEKGRLALNERELIDKYGIRCVSLGFWSKADVFNGSMPPPPSIGEIRSAAALHQSDLQIYNYSADEIGKYPELHEEIKVWARNLHEADVANLITMAPISGLLDDGSGTGRSAVDIWVILPMQYDEATVKDVRVKGDEVWSYNCCVQDDYSPKWQIDYDTINYRIQAGFINQSLGLTGLLYWKVDHWNSDPWSNPLTYSEDGADFNGEGLLIYPGDKAGIDRVVPSIRLKALREGVEDYEYIQILRNLGYGDWALEIVRKVGADWKNWTRDFRVLESARQQLGKKIHNIMQAGKPD